MASSKNTTGAVAVRLASLAALLGAAVSAYNYFDPGSGIQGTGGVQLVIAASLAIMVLGFFARDPRGAPRVLIGVLAFVLIAGTAFAAYLLESTTLLALMGACALAWVLHLGTSRPAYG